MSETLNKYCEYFKIFIFLCENIELDQARLIVIIVLYPAYLVMWT